MSVAGVTALDLASVDDAAGVLVRSFAADPGLLFVLPDGADRDRLSSELARSVVRYALRCGMPLATVEPVRGVALWFPPDSPAPTIEDLDETGIAHVPDRIGPAAWSRFKRMLDHLDALHPEYAPDPHWYLAMIGVDPAWQQRGLGAALLIPALAQADRDGVACYLETPNRENVGFYERHGFRVMAETDIPESDVHIWLMRRDPTHR